MSEPPSPHEIIDYLRACVDAEHAVNQHRVLGSKDVVLLEAGAAPIGDSQATLPDSRRALSWANARESAGSNELLFAGWPLVRGQRRHDGRTTEVAAGLLYTEVALSRSDDGSVLVAPTSRSIDLDEAALGLLGVPSDERAQLLAEYNDAIRPGRTGPLAQAITFLRSAGLIEGDVDASALGPFDAGPVVSNAAIMWVGDADRSAFTRQLIDDLDALRREPETKLTAGPLGVLFGAEPGQPGPLEPTPAVLATTLEQERAICSSTAARLTVVTGPPGTGKSQVLANAVATALAAGETVLLASKNNHAIDVVHDRVDGMHPDATPIRAGNKRFRGEAAQTMGLALTRQQPSGTGLAAARQQWMRARELVERPYEQIAERARLQVELEVARRQADDAHRALPDGATVDPLLVDADLLAASIGTARRRLRDFESEPGRWFWQKKRKRAAEGALDAALLTVTSLAGERAQPAMRHAKTEGPEQVLDLATALVTYLSRLDELQGCEMRWSLLPDDTASDRAISASFATRYPPASELFAATWRDRLRPDAPGRPAARHYHSGLAAKADSGSGIGPLRSQLPDALATFPVWSVTSLAAGAWFPLTSGLFDLVIIDEASQSDIASALPLLYRAKRAMIVGDPHQLAHITSLGPGVDEQLAASNGLDEDVHGRYSYRATSLYGLAASRLDADPVFLNRHFRSHPDVIGFSNKTFYGGRLQIETDPGRYLPGPAFRWHDVRGRYQPGPGGRSTSNPPEATEVIEVLRSVLDELAGTDKTVGVVTPFAPQRDLLRDLATDRIDSRVTIDTAHGFQGDERDVMIFSPAVTDRTPPGLARFAANPNLLNVALTRARARTIVVGDLTAARSSGTLLASLATYADRVATTDGPGRV